MSGFDRGAVKYALTTETTEWDDVLIKKKVASREQCLIAKGFTTEQVIEILVNEHEALFRQGLLSHATLISQFWPLQPSVHRHW